MNEPHKPSHNLFFPATADRIEPAPTQPPSDFARELSRRYADRNSRQQRLSRIGIRVDRVPRAVHFGIRTGTVPAALLRILGCLFFIGLGTIASVVIVIMAIKVSWVIGGGLIMPAFLYLMLALDIRYSWRTLRQRFWLTLEADGWSQTSGPQPGASRGVFHEYHAVQRFSLRYTGSKYSLRPRYTYPYQLMWVDKEGTRHPIGPVVTYEQGMLLKWELQSEAGGPSNSGPRA